MSKSKGLGSEKRKAGQTLGGMTEAEVERRLIAGELNEEILVAFKAHLLAPEDEHDIQPMLGKLCDLAIEGLRAQRSAGGAITDDAACARAAQILRAEADRLEYPRRMVPQEAGSIERRQTAFRRAAEYLEPAGSTQRPSGVSLLPRGWKLERRDDGIVVSHEHEGSVFVREKDVSIAGTLLFYLADDFLDLTLQPDTERRVRALAWAVNTFGEIAADKEERAMRFVEEAVELVNALGLDVRTVRAIVERVYGRQKGDRGRELGQAMFTLELLGEALAIDPSRAADAEFTRCQAIPKEEWERRHKAKVDIGIAK
jgi:hypothetical protein